MAIIVNGRPDYSVLAPEIQTVKLKLLVNRLGQNFVIDLLADPEIRSAVNTLSAPKVGLLCNYVNPDGFQVFLKDPHTVDGLNCVSVEKLLLTLRANFPLDYFQSLLRNPDWVEGANSFTFERFREIIGERDETPTDSIMKELKILDILHTLSVEKVQVLSQFVHDDFMEDTFGDLEQLLKAMMCLNDEKVEIIKQKRIFLDREMFKTITSLSIGKFKLMAEVIETDEIEYVLSNSSIMKQIIETDIERNFKFLSRVDGNVQMDKLLDTQAVYSTLIETIESSLVLKNSKELNTIIDVLYILFYGPESDDCSSPIITKLRELCMLNMLNNIGIQTNATV